MKPKKPSRDQNEAGHRFSINRSHHRVLLILFASLGVLGTISSPIATVVKVTENDHSLQIANYHLDT